MKLYDQQKEDPSGFSLSLALISGIVGIGLLANGQHSIGAVLIFFAAAMVWRATARDRESH